MTRLVDPAVRSAFTANFKGLASIGQAWVEEAQQRKQKRVGKWIENPLSQSGRNNGLQAHEINKWALRRQMGLKEPRKRKTNKPWAVYDVEIENGPQQVQSNESKENKGLMSSP